MQTENCPTCGGVVGKGVAVCPHCGARLSRAVPRVWVLTFFVMGIVIGLLLLLLQQGGWPSFTSLQESLQTVGKEGVGGLGGPQSAPQAPVAPRPSQSGGVHRAQGGPDKAPIVPVYCDREAAEAVRDKARTLAMMSEQGGELLLHLSGDWAYYAEGHRRGFVNAVAEADRCLNGRTRPIHFIYQGEEVAGVDAAGAVQMK